MLPASIDPPEKEKNVPRLYLIGTLVIVFSLTFALGAFFSWQQLAEHRASISRLEAAVTRQLEARLDAEMDSALGYLEFLRSRTEETLRRTVVENVDAGFDMAQAIHARESPHRTEAEVKALIVEALRPIRFYGGRGYYFIDDMQGRFVLLPTAPRLEGQLLPDNQDDTGRFVMRGLIDAARKPRGDGFFSYRWYRPDTADQMADKLAYVRHFAPYDWLIGAGDYTYEWERLQQEEALERLHGLRFGRSGHFGVLDRDGLILLAPSDATLAGVHFDKAPAIEGAALAQIHAKAAQGGGLLRYTWPGTEAGTTATKVALVRTHEPWGWVLVASVFEDEFQLELAAERNADSAGSTQLVYRMLMSVLFALLAASAATVMYSRWAKRVFREYHDKNLAQREALAAQAAELREGESKLAAILDSVEAFIYIKGPDYRYQYVNKQVCALFNCSREDVVGKDDSFFFDEATARALRLNDARVIENGERVALEEANVRAGVPGAMTFLSVKIPLRREDGSIYALCGISTDISKRKLLEDEIRQLAFYDVLTGLPNRRLLIDRLQQQLANSARRRGRGAVLFIDLDNFKTLNDTLGHDKGDVLLQEVARRLVQAVRQIDTVARLGGDEFVVMVTNLFGDEAEAATQARLIGEKILDKLGQPYNFSGQPHFSTPSIGITLFSGSEVSVDDLLKQADLAMYQAKAAGRNTICFFDPQMQAALNARAILEGDLRSGLRSGQFLLYYQAQVNQSGQLIGAEALVRWQHPERGLVEPAAFIPLAEETGLILQLGAWVLDTACEQLRHWGDSIETAALTLSVNVSARQFRQDDFVAQVLGALARSGANPCCLKLELTESLLLNEIEETIGRMNALKAHGVGLSLDDFGTGYSSLSYLKRLPLEQIKIDRTFVRDLLVDPSDAAIASAIISLAESLGLSVIAEGVENVEQRDALARQGCSAYQGYYFGRPGPVEDLFRAKR